MNNTLLRIFFLEIFLILLCSIGKIGFLLLKIFGYNIFIFPFFLINIPFPIIVLSISIILDNFILFPFKFCGAIGEILLLFNKKTFFIPSILTLGIVIFFIFQNFYKVDNIFHIFSSKKTIEPKSENYSDLISKILEKYSIHVQIREIHFTPIFSRYYMTSKNFNFTNRFFSLSPDISDILKVNTRTYCDLEYMFIEVENIEKITFSFEKFKTHHQPDSFLLMDGNTPTFLDIKNNFLCCVNSNIIHSLIMSILLTSENSNIILSGEDQPSFTIYSDRIINNSKIGINEIIEEMERRYHLIIEFADNIFEYNKKKNPISFLHVFLKISSSLTISTIIYLTQYGKKVGVFLILYHDSLLKTLEYKPFFNNLISNKLQDKKESVEFFGISSAEYLSHDSDTMIKYGDMFFRAIFPFPSLEEIAKTVHFTQNKTI